MNGCVPISIARKEMWSAYWAGRYDADVECIKTAEDVHNREDIIWLNKSQKDLDALERMADETAKDVDKELGR